MAVHEFRDRRAAGRALAQALAAYADQADVRVLALPRGGVPVAFEVARALHAPLDVFVVRKLGVPGQEEYAMGAIATGQVQVLDDDVVRQLGIGEAAIARVAEAERAELQRREQCYRSGRPALDVDGCKVLLVDDGLATGSTMRAAVRALRLLQPARVVVCSPVASVQAEALLRGEADEVTCLLTPPHFHAVGAWYTDFSQTTDEEVMQLLDRAHGPA
ncbi:MULTISPECIES: phosphoribosyltransferase [unclassified Variovorax]|uniref:phosphoribosyltransferase n=1 Tax=unclassified Variovorax TaxID=663243 RepID=UPI001BD5E48F|nr:MULTISPECIES: phosphoribosyltransferase [unclassified Variovorax]